MKCKKCKKLIPKGKESHVNNINTKNKNSVLCPYCFYKLKIPSRRTGGGNSLQRAYERWMEYG